MQRKRLLSMQDSFEQRQTHGGENYIVNRQELEAERGRVLAGKDGGGGGYHGQQRRNADGEQQQGQHELAAAGAQRQGREKRAIHHQRPGPENEDPQQRARSLGDSEIKKNDEQRRHNGFQQRHENEITEGLSQKQSISGSAGDAEGVERLMAELARPALVQRHGGREQERHPHQPTSDTASFFGGGFKGEAENHHHQQREEKHGVERVFGAPFQPQVFAQSGDSCAHQARGRRGRPELHGYRLFSSVLHPAAPALSAEIPVPCAASSPPRSNQEWSAMVCKWAA